MKTQQKNKVISHFTHLGQALVLQRATQMAGTELLGSMQMMWRVGRWLDPLPAPSRTAITGTTQQQPQGQRSKRLLNSSTPHTNCLPPSTAPLLGHRILPTPLVSKSVTPFSGLTQTVQNFAETTQGRWRGPEREKRGLTTWQSSHTVHYKRLRAPARWFNWYFASCIFWKNK